MTADDSATIQDLLKSHRQLIEAEHERIDLERERVKAEQKKAVSEHRRAAAVEDLLSKVGELIQRVDQLTRLLTTLVSQYPPSASIQELTDEVRDGLGRNADRQLLQLDLLHFVLGYIPDRNDKKAELSKRINQAMAAPHIDSLRKQMTTSQRKLDRLQEQAAQHGIDVPIEITTGIEDTKIRIDELARELDECCQ